MKRPWQKSLQRAFLNGRVTPGEFVSAFVVDAIVLTALLVFLLTCASWAVGAELVPGAVLVSRNISEAENSSPGHMNHLAIAISPTEVVESQAGIGVQKITLADYLKRNYETPYVLLPKDRAVGERAATKAATFVGTKFAKASSIFRRQNERRGMNCVGVIKASYFDAHRKVRTIKIPDDIWKLKEVFEPARRLERPSGMRGAGDRFGWYTHHRGQRGGILRELMSRCPQYGLNQIRGFDPAGQVHEATHFVNNELSASFQQSYGAFYVGEGRYCVLLAPDVTVGQVAPLVPHARRNSHYQNYLTKDWRQKRNCLAIFDEWTCYTNEAQCSKELRDGYKGGLERAQCFSGFADCVVQAVKQHDTSYDLEPLTRFVDWQKNRVAELSK